MRSAVRTLIGAAVGIAIGLSVAAILGAPNGAAHSCPSGAPSSACVYPPNTARWLIEWGIGGLVVGLVLSAVVTVFQEP